MDDAPVDWTRTILLFAFVFITFVNWLVTRLRERAAERRMRREEQAAEAEARKIESPQTHRTLRERERAAPVNRPTATETAPPPPTKAEAELRKFFEALGLPVEESEEEAAKERRRRAEAEEESEARAARQAREEAEARRRSETRERQGHGPGRRQTGQSSSTSTPEPPPIPQQAKAAASRAVSRTITRVARSAVPGPIEAGDLALRRTGRPTAALEVTGGSRQRHRERQADLRRLLQSPQTLRQAVLLREILDPPRGLQSQESLTKL